MNSKSRSKDQNKAYIYAAFAVLFWSTAPTAFKLTLKFIKPVEMLFYSSLTAALTILVIIIFQKKANLIFSAGKREIFYSALLGFMNPFLYYLILFKAYTLLPAQLAQPLNFVWPVMIVILSIPILKQKIPIKNLLAILISFFGVILISTKGRLFSLEIDEPFGVLLALSSSIIWALFFILNVENKNDELIRLFLSFTFGCVFTFIVALPKLSVPSSIALLGSAYIGLFEMGITFIIWIKALKCSTTTAQVNNLIYITPFLSFVFVSIFLKEKILITSFIGVSCIILGIILQNRSSSNLGK